MNPDSALARATLRRSTLPRPEDRAPGRPSGSTLPHTTERPSRAARLWRGRPEDPRWARPALIGLLALTALLYLWDLSASGWANSFYSAAVQAGSESWKAFFFGSSDAGNSITVDKTPLALWPMALSVRIFGLSSWSILAPQAVEGVLAVALLHATVRRSTGSAAAGLLAGLTLAITPVAVLMFKFNNPDAMLVLLLVAAVYSTLRAAHADPVRGHPVRWLSLAGALVGLAFLAKMLQAFLVLPPLVLVYLLVAGAPFWRRIGHLLVAFGAMLVAGGWWVAIVSLWPASSRPYIGGSQTNSVLELTLGYNGFGRLTGDETGSVGGGGRGTGGGMWGETGILRLFNTEIGGQVAWLVPAALVLLVAGLWLTRRNPRRDGVRAGLVVWGGWLLVTGLTFSFMAGIFHAYYTVALAPAVAALVGTGAWLLWARRGSVLVAAVAAFTVAMTAVLGFVLLGRSADFLPWLRWVVLVGGLLAAVAVVGIGHLPRRLALAAAGAAVVVGLAGPAAYAVQTATTGHSGSIVDAGPSTGSSGGPGGGRGGPGAATRPPGGFQQNGTTQNGGTQNGGTRNGTTQNGTTQNGTAQNGTGTAPGRSTGGGSTGGLLTGSSSTSKITALLQADAGSYTWAAATIGSNSASGYQLASQQPVMAIGGFNGSDPSPTLAQFEAWVKAGKVHYFIASGSGGMRGGPSAGGSTASAISSWVSENFTATTVDGVTLYDLTSGTAS